MSVISKTIIVALIGVTALELVHWSSSRKSVAVEELVNKIPEQHR